MATKKKSGAQALGDAMREAREALGMSQRQAASRSRQLDEELTLTGSGRARPGITYRTWGGYERAEQGAPHASSLMIIDLTLGWPRGTAAAYLKGEPLPEGEPLEAELRRASAGPAGDDTHLRREVARLRTEVAEMREEMLMLLERLGGRA